MDKKRFPLIIFISLFSFVIISFLFINLKSDLQSSNNYDEFKDSLKLIKNNKQVTLNWIGDWHGEDKREKLLNEVSTKFEFTHPEINLNLKFPEDILGERSFESMGKFIAHMIKTGKYEWDVVWIETNIYNVVASELNDYKWGEKYLINLEDVPGFLETQKSYLLKDSFYRNQTGGIIISPFIEGYYMALWYNSDVAKMAGIEIKKSGMRFNDLLTYVEKLQNYNKLTNSDISPFYESSDWITLSILFQNLVKSAFMDDKEIVNFKLSDAKLLAMKETLASFEKLAQFNPLMNDFQQNKWFNTRDMILEDKALFYVNGTWMYSHWMGVDSQKMKKMIPAELPVFKETDYYLGGYNPTFAVLKNAPHWHEGIKLLKFWSTPEVAEKWVRYTKNPTGIKGDHFNEEIYDDEYNTFQEYLAKKYGTNVQYSNDISYLLGNDNKMLTKIVEQELIKVLKKETTADQAYLEILSKLVK